MGIWPSSHSITAKACLKCSRQFFFRVFDCQEQTINGYPVWSIKPKHSNPKNHVLFFHGGAYVQTFNYFHWRFFAQMILSQGCAVHAPNYPFAPESHTPQTIEMALQTYQHLLANPDLDRIAIMGDSAGGGLVLALTQMIRD